MQASDTRFDLTQDSTDTVGSSYHEKLDHIGCVMNHLNSVRLESKVHNIYMLEFACFLLARAQVLQLMTIQSKVFSTPNALQVSKLCSTKATWPPQKLRSCLKTWKAMISST